MALVHTTVSRLQPAIALNVALRDFEAILTDDEKARFATSVAPDANTAIKLALEIDHENASRRSRCLGTRLMKFLESVQQFSDVVGTFVSSSPQIAALVWGGVKLCLLVANNFASYFDKISNVFMQIGRTCPRIAKFGALYITSTRLQQVLCEYYAVVVTWNITSSIHGRSDAMLASSDNLQHGTILYSGPNTVLTCNAVDEGGPVMPYDFHYKARNERQSQPSMYRVLAAQEEMLSINAKNEGDTDWQSTKITGIIGSRAALGDPLGNQLPAYHQQLLEQAYAGLGYGPQSAEMNSNLVVISTTPEFGIPIQDPCRTALVSPDSRLESRT